MHESRTQKSIRNTIFSVTYKLFDTVLAFMLRTVFIRCLSVSYLGLNSLFANILTVLSLMELGVGGSIVFALYKPLAEKDSAKVAALMGLYKKVYNTVGILVLIVGISLTPVLHHIVNLPESIDFIYLIYWLTVINTSITYFLSYKRSLLLADQRSDINSKNLIFFRVIRFILLTICLIVTKNYIVYLIVDIIVTFCSNLHITYIVNKSYKSIFNIKDKTLNNVEKRNILKFMYSGIISKIGQTVVNSTDNILISSFISTVLVGVYANYSMITMNIQVMIYLLFNSLTASIGNFAVQKNGEEAEGLFKKVFFANFVIVYIITICLYCLLSPFVIVWVGKKFLLDNITVVVIIINFYFAVMQYACENFMGAVGELFYINRYRSLVEAIVNLLVSIILVKFTNLGITGVFLGTTACFICGRIWMDAKTLYKYWFKVSFKQYIKIYFEKIILTVVTGILIKEFTNLYFSFFGINVYTWLIAAISIVVILIILIIILFRNKIEFQYYKELIKKIVCRFLYKVKNYGG